MTTAAIILSEHYLGRVAELVLRNRLPLNDEKRTQAALAELMAADDLPAEREVRLSAEDIPDFMVGALAVEVKLRAPKRAIYRQLARYAQHERVSRILLVTNTAMGLPAEINGKPARLVHLGEAWL